MIYNFILSIEVMFHKNVYIDSSGIHGIGLFVGEEIIAGEQIWTPSVLLNYHLTQKDFDQLIGSDQHLFMHYGYFHKDDQVWHLSSENIRFVNHSDDSNITRDLNTEGVVALRNIRQGEELVQNYAEFEELRNMI